MNTIKHFDGAEQFFDICKQLKGKRVGILGHLHPDGDCLGAQIAMHNILIQCGAVPLLGLYNDYIASNLRWVSRDYIFTKPEEMATDEYVFVDCSVKLRAGDFAKKLPMPLLSVDHHISGERFAHHNFFHPEAAAACEIIADFLHQKQWEISSHTATALYVGMVTDTGKFSYSSTNTRTLFLALQLALHGADPHRICTEIYQNEPREKFALLQRFLASLQFYADGAICIGHVTERDYLETHTTSEDREDFVDYPRAIRGVRVAVITHYRDGKICVSLRSNDPALRLDLLARKFSGGGHTCAASFTIEGIWEKFEKVFINKLRAHLDSFSVKHL
ncbi:MAG: DHH family phosphoesterase [Puniceicoccales bacterium]|jgi:phosphoesterase RecJ-like protein|nr:DHH family phosphoesterase [Puniceicoccales bacterium]